MSIRKIHQPIQRINGKYNNEYQRFIRARTYQGIADAMAEQWG